MNNKSYRGPARGRTECNGREVNLSCQCRKSRDGGCVSAASWRAEDGRTRRLRYCIRCGVELPVTDDGDGEDGSFLGPLYVGTYIRYCTFHGRHVLSVAGASCLPHGSSKMSTCLACQARGTASPRQLEKDGKAEKAEQADGSSSECPSPRQAL